MSRPCDHTPRHVADIILRIGQLRSRHFTPHTRPSNRIFVESAGMCYFVAHLVQFKANPLRWIHGHNSRYECF